MNNTDKVAETIVKNFKDKELDTAIKNTKNIAELVKQIMELKSTVLDQQKQIDQLKQEYSTGTMLTAEETRQYLNVSKRIMYALFRKELYPDFPGIKMGQKYYVNSKMLNEWLINKSAEDFYEPRKEKLKIEEIEVQEPFEEN